MTVTEAEWLASDDPTPMLDLLAGRASARKLRLFACAAAHLRAGRPDECLDRWQADVAAVERGIRHTSDPIAATARDKLKGPGRVRSRRSAG